MMREREERQHTNEFELIRMNCDQLITTTSSHVGTTKDRSTSNSEKSHTIRRSTNQSIN